MTADSFDEDLATQVAAGDRRALARLITLLESTRADHRARAEALLEALLPHTGKAVRLGLSGPPGVGKSTFIEAFGRHLIGLGRSVAVLAIDPSSRVTGGSILGDKTRMAELSREPRAFIRPSPSAGTLGGVARHTADAILAVEAAGFDTILVETVGVGQSETAVADMVDLFCLLHQPHGGDDLQGIKKGVVELADLIVVNKADGETEAAAGRAAAELKSALSLLRADPRWRPPVLLASALDGKGLDAVWREIERYRAVMQADGAWEAKRSAQARARLWSGLAEELTERMRLRPEAVELERRVAAGELTPNAAIRALLDSLV